MSRARLLALLVAVLPAAVAAQPSRDAAFHLYLQDIFAEARADSPDLRYVSAWADLNYDGRPEAIVSVLGGPYCGSGGCSLFVFTPARRSWRPVGSTAITRRPVRLLTTRRNGWRDIGVMAGGAFGRIEIRLSFDGRAYPWDPSGPYTRPLTGAAPGRVLIEGGDRGRPLF